MRMLFTSAQLAGHLDWGGYLATAVALNRRGHEVLWASGQAVGGLVSAGGLSFHTLAETGWRWPPPPPLQLPPETAPALVRQMRAERALDQWLAVERVQQATHELIELGRRYQPELLVSEVFVSAAGLAAEALAIPLVVAGWPAAPPKAAAADDELITSARTRLQRLLAHFELAGRHWTPSGPPALLSPHLHLTYWSSRWYGDLALLPQTQHVGGRSATASPTLSTPEADPTVFITLGTSFGNDPAFFVAAAQAAVHLGCRPILALGGQLNAAQREALQQRLPPEAVLREAVDFQALLPQVAAAIHHGGAGTTHALVTHAVPQIIVPHAAEQMHQAQGVVRSGVGLHLAAKDVTMERLVHALAQALPDRGRLRANAQTLRDEFAELGGVERAAALIERVTVGE